MEPVKEVKKSKPKLTDAEKKLVDSMSKHYEVLKRDKLQDQMSWVEYLKNKLSYLKRVRERNLKRAESEMPKDLTEKQKAVYMEGESFYENEIKLLESAIKKL